MWAALYEAFRQMISSVIIKSGSKAHGIKCNICSIVSGYLRNKVGRRCIESFHSKSFGMNRRATKRLTYCLKWVVLHASWRKFIRKEQAAVNSNKDSRIRPVRGLPSMTSALEGGEGVVAKWTRVLISWVIMYVTRGEGVKKFEIFMDVIDGSPLSLEN